MRIGICDDEPQMRAVLEQTVLQWVKDGERLCQVQSFASAEQLLFAYEEQAFDILLLDIEMPGMNGIDLSKKIRETDEHVQLIFITAVSDFIGEGYEVAALHYLIKPVKPEKIAEVMDKACKNLKSSEAVLSLQTESGVRLILQRSISYLEANGHYITVHTDDGNFEKKSTLQEMLSKLDERFYRCQRSFAVNLFRVKKVSRTEVELTGGCCLPLSRGLYDEIHQKLMDLYPEGVE